MVVDQPRPEIPLTTWVRVLAALQSEESFAERMARRSREAWDAKDKNT